MLQPCREQHLYEKINRHAHGAIEGYGQVQETRGGAESGRVDARVRAIVQGVDAAAGLGCLLDRTFTPPACSPLAS